MGEGESGAREGERQAGVVEIHCAALSDHQRGGNYVFRVILSLTYRTVFASALRFFSSFFMQVLSVYSKTCLL